MQSTRGITMGVENSFISPSIEIYKYSQVQTKRNYSISHKRKHFGTVKSIKDSVIRGFGLCLGDHDEN